MITCFLGVVSDELKTEDVTIISNSDCDDWLKGNTTNKRYTKYFTFLFIYCLYSFFMYRDVRKGTFIQIAKHCFKMRLLHCLTVVSASQYYYR